MQMLISATQAGAESSPVGFGLDDHAGNQAAEPQGGAVASYVWFFRVPWLQILYPQLVASVAHPVVPQIPIPSYTYKAMICYDLIKPSGFNSWLLPLQFFFLNWLFIIFWSWKHYETSRDSWAMIPRHPTTSREGSLRDSSPCSRDPTESLGMWPRPQDFFCFRSDTVESPAFQMHGVLTCWNYHLYFLNSSWKMGQLQL